MRMKPPESLDEFLRPEWAPLKSGQWWNKRSPNRLEITVFETIKGRTQDEIHVAGLSRRAGNDRCRARTLLHRVGTIRTGSQLQSSVPRRQPVTSRGPGHERPGARRQTRRDR